MVPSRRRPSSRYCTWPRPCGIETMFSERVSIHFTGRPSSSRDAHRDEILGRPVLGPERTTHVRCDESDLLRIDAERGRHRRPVAVRHLAREVQGQVVAGAVVARDDRDRRCPPSARLRAAGSRSARARSPRRPPAGRSRQVRACPPAGSIRPLRTAVERRAPVRPRRRSPRRAGRSRRSPSRRRRRLAPSSRRRPPRPRHRRTAPGQRRAAGGRPAG